MLNRVLTLVFSYFFAALLVMGVGEVVGLVAGTAFQILPAGVFLGSSFVLTLVLSAAVAALLYGLSAFFFSLWTNLPWREAGLWVLVGVTALDAVRVGRGAFLNPIALALQVSIGAAAAFAVCRRLERDAGEPWLERARELLQGFIPS